ncbi:UNVERIFIED_CONTAM: hypothetical protein FKN15_035201 [Acipenser sinensis]
MRFVITVPGNMEYGEGIIKKDPKLPENTLWPPPCPRTGSSVFDEEDKSKLLARLLKSSHPDDLQAANRLIKNTVKEDQDKMEKVSKRINAIEEVQNNTKLLNEMLTNYRRRDISDSDRDIMKELVERRDVNGNNGSNHSETKGTQALSREAFPIGGKCKLFLVTSIGGLKYMLPLKAFPLLGVRPVLQPRSALGDLQNHPITSSARHTTPFSPTQRELTDSSLSDVFVSLDSIKLVVSPAGGILPVTAYDKNGFRVMLHFARDPPAGRADVLVTVLSMLSTSPLPIRNIVFQAAVPKAVRIKLQTATSSELPAFNPILPPAVISQVMLLTNPQKEKVRLRFKLSFTQGGQSFCELGEVEHFPEISSWTGH